MSILEDMKTLSQLYPLPSTPNPLGIGLEYNIQLTIQRLYSMGEIIEKESTEEVIEAVNYFIKKEHRSFQGDLKYHTILWELERKLNNKNPRPSCSG